MRDIHDHQEDHSHDSNRVSIQYLSTFKNKYILNIKTKNTVVVIIIIIIKIIKIKEREDIVPRASIPRKTINRAAAITHAIVNKQLAINNGLTKLLLSNMNSQYPIALSIIKEL